MTGAVGFALQDKWVWDFWLAQRGAEHHIFYLQAPRSLTVPGLRHHNATIGHAVSEDFARWEVLPDALGPGPAGDWDDLATWTGSVLRFSGKWCMLYTGVSKAEDGRAQRIGLATSEDLVHWHKHPANPVLEADGRWYQVLGDGAWPDQAWRDPWLFVPGDGAMVHALVTARAGRGAPDSAGVLGHARSADLVDWEILPPLATPAEFAQMEVPQLVQNGDGSCTVLFSCLATDHSAVRRSRSNVQARAGTFALWGPSLRGPFSVGDSPVMAAGEVGALYAGKVVDTTEGLGFMAFKGGDDSEFEGEIVGPLTVPDLTVPAKSGDGRPSAGRTPG